MPRAETDPSTTAPTASTLDGSLRDGQGFIVFRAVVPDDVVDRARRLLNIEIVQRGLTADEISGGAYSALSPQLRSEPAVMDVRGCIESVIQPRHDETWADAQISLRFPDLAEDRPLTPHVDALPARAADRSHRAIVGVALAPSGACDGSLVVWPRSHVGEATDPVRVELAAGDIVVMHPMLQHSSTLNRGGEVCCALYFRLRGCAREAAR
jgi:hypothetical protein